MTAVVTFVMCILAHVTTHMTAQMTFMDWVMGVMIRVRSVRLCLISCHAKALLRQAEDF